MITFTPEQFMLVIIAGPTFAAILLFIYVVGKRSIGNIVNIIRSHREYKRRFKEVVEMKERGESHEWVNILVSAHPPREAHVCKKTGYCPTLNGFFDVKYVQDVDRSRRNAEEYNLYRNRKLADIALKHGVEFDKFMEMIDEVIAIPKEYTVGKLDDLQKELKGE